ncbi:hypothetical protein TNCV_4589011 [Trichonephila clavipes]|nr:hypothetical protein TNCV_4589011 [Trichonephila clavipes]
MYLMAWLLLWWIDGAMTAAREGCGSLCPDRVTIEERLELGTFCSENEYLSHHAKTIIVEWWLLLVDIDTPPPHFY